MVNTQQFISVVPCFFLFSWPSMGPSQALVTLGVSLLLDGSSMSCSPLEHPSFISSASFLPRDHLQSCPQQYPLPHSSSFFSKPASLLTSSGLIFWVSSCVSSHISYSCVSCPQQLPPFLKHTWAEAPRAPLAGWTFEAQWAVAILFRVIWNQLWLAQGSSWPPSTQTFCSLCYQTQPFIPNTETWKLKWCIFWMLHLLCFHNSIDTCMNVDFVYNLYKNWAQIHFIISLLCCSYLVYTNIQQEVFNNFSHSFSFYRPMQGTLHQYLSAFKNVKWKQDSNFWVTPKCEYLTKYSFFETCY